MTKNKKIITTLIVGLPVVAVAALWRRCITNLDVRFPEIETKIIREAYRNMLINAVTNKYSNVIPVNYTDEDLKEIFLMEVHKVAYK